MKTKLIVNVRLLDNRSVYEEEMECAEFCFCVGKEYVWLGLDTIPISQVKEITVKFLHEEESEDQDEEIRLQQEQDERV